MGELSREKCLRVELAKQEEKLSEIRALLNHNKKKEMDVNLEIRKLTEEIECLEKKKEKIPNCYEKMIVMLILVIATPLLFIVLYQFLAFFGMKFVNATDIVIKHLYALTTLFGGGFILLVGPKAVREISNIITKICSHRIMNSSRYKSLCETVDKQKVRLASLHMDKRLIQEERTNLLFESSKYNASLQLGKWALNNLNHPVVTDYSHDVTGKITTPYTRKRAKR